jgi:hypothetical protein
MNGDYHKNTHLLKMNGSLCDNKIFWFKTSLPDGYVTKTFYEPSFYTIFFIISSSQSLVKKICFFLFICRLVFLLMLPLFFIKVITILWDHLFAYFETKPTQVNYIYCIDTFIFCTITKFLLCFSTSWIRTK